MREKWLTMAARNRTKWEQFTSSLLVPSWLTSQSSAWEHDHGPVWTHLRLLHGSPGLAELGLAPARRSKAPFHRDFVKDVGTRCQGFVHHLWDGFEKTKVRHSALLQQHSGRLLAPAVPWPGCCARSRRAAWPALAAAGPAGWAPAAAAATGAAARCPCATAPGWSDCSALPPCWKWPSSPHRYSGTEWEQPRGRSGKQPRAQVHKRIIAQGRKHLSH